MHTFTLLVNIESAFLSCKQSIKTKTQVTDLSDKINNKTTNFKDLLQKIVSVSVTDQCTYNEWEMVLNKQAFIFVLNFC